MKIPITDLMDDCCPEQVIVGKAVNTDAVKENILARIHAEIKPVRHFRPGVLLVAAALMTLLVGSAVAYERAIYTHSVDDAREADRIVVYYDDTGKVVDADVLELPDAQFAVSYQVDQPQYNVIEYKLGWLPYPAHNTWPKPVSTEGWLDNVSDAYIQNDGYYAVPDHPYRQLDEMLYQIQVTGLTDSDAVHYYSGTPTVVKEDTWEGWNRLEFTIDYTDSTTVFWGRPINYLILFDPESSVKVQIAGTMDFETYEKIAENMEVRVTDELHYVYTEEWQEYMANYELSGDIVGNAVIGDLGVG